MLLPTVHASSAHKLRLFQKSIYALSSKSGKSLLLTSLQNVTSSPTFSSQALYDDRIQQDHHVTNATNDSRSTSSWRRYPHLFQSLELPNGIILPNRVLMGSMHSGLEGHSMPKWMEKCISPGDADHDLSRMAYYFQERAKGGCGLMVSFVKKNKKKDGAPLCKTVDFIILRVSLDGFSP
jgi:hypothetical protein